MNWMPSRLPTQRGATLVEVLVSALILGFGLLGLAGLQAKVQAANAEAYQRAEALLVLQDMANRIRANGSNAAAYAVTGTLGTDDAQPSSCTGLPIVAKDQCEWSALLKGASEQLGTGKLGGALDARGCIAVAGSAPAVVRITVAWRAVSPLAAVPLDCGKGLYGNDAQRRAIAATVTVAS